MRLSKRIAGAAATLASAAALTVTAQTGAHASTTADWLSKGDTGSGVSCVQVAINYAHNWWPGSVATVRTDAMFGQLTANGVVAIQRIYGLSQDGIVGPRTGDRLWQIIHSFDPKGELHPDCYWDLPTLS
ncbi:hypothetical protein GCM10009839_49530 [Catenulispora yoronensis]|uniref:Peptidoglycan binding-like domain-containing protein n=1 Tax=Catenulispora yoronensis TaxID=450799 RepID=A0ABN2UPA0_9ACTN